ncbi:MAG: P1 family peptidase [Burkholderiaceae bacterium]
MSLPPAALLPADGAITDVAGIRVGHDTDSRRPTGCTVVLAEGGAVAGVDVRGAAPGTRETDLLAPVNLIDRVHAVLLTGGSAFGLDAASGVVQWLEARGIGLPVGPVRVPIVPAAVLFDLYLGDPSVRPDAAAGRRACEAATDGPVAQGSVGAGSGATVGKLFGFGRAMKGGIGSASARVGGVTVGAIVAVNAIGDIVDPATGQWLAGARDDDGLSPLRITRAILSGQRPAAPTPGEATTIGVIATDAIVTKAQAQKLAQMGHDGLARTIDPVHTMADGDTLFALGTGLSGVPADPFVLGPAVAAVTAEAVLRAVRAAVAAWLPSGLVVPAWRDRQPGDSASGD